MKTYSSVPLEGEKRRNIPCPLCGTDKIQPHWEVGKSLFSRCRNCGLIHQNPQPELQHLVERYDQQYFDYELENQASFLNLMHLGLKDVGFPLHPPTAGEIFLDVGCATGALLEDMNQRTWKGQGIEICRESAEYAKEKRGVEVFCGTLEDWDGEDESLWVFHSSHVIEHLVNPREFVERAFRLLKPGGHFLCTTPCASGFQARWFGAKWRSAIEDHLCLFSRKQMKSLLSQQGFKIVNQKSWGGLAMGAGRPGLKKILDPLAKGLNWGDVMVFWARKPLV